MTTTYYCDGFRRIRREDDSFDTTDPARIFAERKARRMFGRRGYCRTLRLNSWSEDGSSLTFEAFVGFTSKHNPTMTEGRNIWLHISRRGGR